VGLGLYVMVQRAGRNFLHPAAAALGRGQRAMRPQPNIRTDNELPGAGAYAQDRLFCDRSLAGAGICRPRKTGRTIGGLHRGVHGAPQSPRAYGSRKM